MVQYQGLHTADYLLKLSHCPIYNVYTITSFGALQCYFVIKSTENKERPYVFTIMLSSTESDRDSFYVLTVREWKLLPVSVGMFNSSTTWDRSTTHPKFDPTGVRTHDFQIMTVHSMSLRRPSVTFHLSRMARLSFFSPPASPQTPSRFILLTRTILCFFFLSSFHLLIFLLLTSHASVQYSVYNMQSTEITEVNLSTNTIHMYSGIISGNLSVFVYRLFYEDFLSIYGSCRLKKNLHETVCRQVQIY